MNVESWASKCKAILNIKVYAAETVMFILHAESYIFITKLCLQFSRRTRLVPDIWKARLSCIIVSLPRAVLIVLKLVLSKSDV